MCGMVDRKSMASTMGFTAIDGLMMGTRTGAIDPGVLIYLMDNKGMGSPELTRLLYKESGLLGVSGISQDMRTLLASGAPEAEEAIDLYCFRIVREIGSLAAAIGGIDALVFTGGIGEHAAEIRRRVCSRLGWLGCDARRGRQRRGPVAHFHRGERGRFAGHPDQRRVDDRASRAKPARPLKKFFYPPAPAPQGPGALFFGPSRGIGTCRRRTCKKYYI